LDRDAATVDNPQFRLLAPVAFDQPARPQVGGDLLAFVLVDLAAERLNGKGSHCYAGRN
jgi:hypothetical protein